MVAHKLFKDKGYINTSIVVIVEKVKSKGTFYNIFPNTNYEKLNLTVVNRRINMDIDLQLGGNRG